MICITKKIFDWSDKKYEEAFKPGTKHPIRKAVVSGSVEGFIDGVVLSYPILLVGCIYLIKKIY